MKQSLEFKLGQHLTITPQLQQAIRLLQLSSIELQQEIQEALETNPLLEEQEDDVGREHEGGPEEERDDPDAIRATDTEMADSHAKDDADVDNDWPDADPNPDPFETRTTTTDSSASEALPDLESRNSAEQSLRDHLVWQMNLTPFSLRDRDIALTLIDAIDDDGYLHTPLTELAETLSSEDDEIEIDEIEAVLHQIQNFDPLGVGARDLAECLQLQMKAMSADTPFLAQARALATSEGLALLARRDPVALKRKYNLSTEEMQAAVHLIQGLNPRPGASINAPQAAYITPDIIVKKIKGVWRAELNHEVSRKLQINLQYEKMIQHDQHKSDDRKYLQDQLQQAKWFIKSLKSRNDTLLKVARTIIERQRAFFDHGPEAMKPLVLSTIAEAVEMHESTISRVTTNKYMLTPRGIFELKYFFSSHVSTSDGGTCSATAIRSLIQKLIEAESSDKPISDSKIADILSEQGINVARRTIAKYRESMNIPPSNQRKSLI